jgi:vitamin B12 transporter
LPAFAVEQQQTVDEMVVSASRTEERARDVPITSQVINRDMIEMSGAVDVGDLIGKYITGHYHKYPGILSPVGLRGFRSDSHGSDLAGYVLILIDGHRVGTGNAAKINMDRIERVEVIKGPSSALYGSAAMGGVINLITKKGEGELGGSISGDYGSFDYYKGQVSGGGTINDKFCFFATVSTESTGDYDDPTYGMVYNSAVDKQNIGGNLIYTLSENHEFRIGGNYSKLKSESSSWLYGTYTEYDPNEAGNSDKSTGYSDFEYNGDFLSGKLHWKGVAYYLWDKNDWRWGATDPDSEQTKYIDKTIGTDQQFHYKIADWNRLLVGFTLETMEKESSAVSNYQLSVPYTPGLDYNNQALFVQDSLDLFNKRVNIIAAARYDRFEVSTKQAETGTYTEFAEKSEDYDHISPKIGAGIKFFDEMLRLRANVGEGFKSPAANQLAADYVHSSTGEHYVGNPDLDPETSLTFGTGFDVYLEAFTLNVDYYHTDYKDKIVRESSTVNGVSTVSYENHGDAKISGVDVSFEWAIGQMLELPVAVSLSSNMSFVIDKEDEETGDELLYMSDYEIKSGVNIGYAGLTTQLSNVLVGPQMITNYDNYLVEEKDSFDFWDLTLRYRFNDSWEIRGSIFNLFDQEVEWVRGNLMAERNFRLGLTYNF